jgi:hypothetical protein
VNTPPRIKLVLLQAGVAVHLTVTPAFAAWPFNFKSRDPEQKNSEVIQGPAGEGKTATAPRDGDEEITTVTVVRKKTVGKKTKEPPPPPEPPAAEAAEPKRLVRYFCKLWKDEDYEKMWWAMDPAYRKEKRLEAFVKLFEDDKNSNGGLADENIGADEAQKAVDVELNVTLTYRSKRAKPRHVVAAVRKTVKGYRIVQSGLLPVDLDDL